MAILPFSDTRVFAARGLWLAGVLCLWPGPAAAEDFHFARLDRSYSDFVEELEPIQMGPAEITLVSPHQTLTLISHRASLEPIGERRFSVVLELEVEGSGTLDAHVKMGLINSRLADELVLPHQTLSGWGEIEIERGETGYDIVLLRSQEQIQVEIRSRLAGRIVPLCRQMGLVLVHMDCAALELALSQVVVPLPPPGTRFFLALDELSEEEAARLDDLLLASSSTTLKSGNARVVPPRRTQ